MKTQEKIKQLCKAKYNIPISLYEKKLGYANGSLSGEGVIKSDRLLAIARDLGVTMESLMDDDLLKAFEIKVENNNIFSDEEVNLINAYRATNEITKDNICLLLGVKRAKQKKVVG